jgi:eukaryotic-like serine/threonine-protein kinase
MPFKFEIEDRIGRYPIEREIGRGATSRVYLGRDPNADNRPVAVKVFFFEEHQSAEDIKVIRKAFVAEAALAGRLSHPHIVEILDAVSEPHYSYLVMEYVEGGTLDDHADAATLLPVPKVVEIAFKCIRALDYAFQRGVVHRDIKPGNILFSPAGEIKVSDFGASFQEALVQETTQLTGVGSPAYMSPEQIRLEPLNHQTDIYSLGVVIYKLLTGRLPYNASNPLSLTYEILNVKPQPPSTLRPDLPRMLDEICLRAMEKSPSARYQSWIEFGKELSRAFGVLRSTGAKLSDSEKYADIRVLPFFDTFDDVVLWEALRIGAWREIAAGDAVICEGDNGDGFYIMVKGKVAVTLGGKHLATLTAGACFGEMAYFNEIIAPRSTTVTAIEPLFVLEIKATSLRLASEVCQNAFQRAFIDMLLERLTHANRRLAALTRGPNDTAPAS